MQSIEPEIWKPVVGFQGLYEVSNHGRVKRINIGRDSREKLLKATPNKLGYMLVGLHREGKSNTRRVHRLVLEAFIGPCPEEARSQSAGAPARGTAGLWWATQEQSTLLAQHCAASEGTPIAAETSLRSFATQKGSKTRPRPRCAANGSCCRCPSLSRRSP